MIFLISIFFEESPLVTDNNCIDDISSFNLLNEVTNLFIPEVGEVNDNVFYEEDLDLNDNNCIGDISSLNLLNDVANLFIPEVDEVNDKVYKEDLDLNTGGTNKSSSKRKRSLVDAHPLLRPCNCKKKCVDNFPDAKRRKIHEEYWKISRSQQREFIFQRINSELKKRTRIRNSPKKQRKFTRKYTFRNETGEPIQVCSQFFLNTLGYKISY